MILEALNYAATYRKTQPEFRPYIKYSVNLWARANRCGKAWAEHEQNSKRFILSTAAKLKQRRTAVVLGSGLLRDVPWQQLAAAFDTVVLVDLVHLASVRARLYGRKYRNVVLNSRDLSGYDALKAGSELEPLSFLRLVPYLDLVVSANLLSQIGTGARHRLEKEGAGGMPEDALKRLIKAHVDGLEGLPCKVCLVTDTGFNLIDKNGKLHQQEDLLHGVEIPKIANRWDWTLAPFGEESRDYQIIHKVVASEVR
ncbi:hypothetical protein [Agrobacterium larrymoorei]|uniref:Class I SAM-dependent methyltransferase n=1 Tax=Agrobacterium larrymoorei TaxID=160699 RepID=A0A4D7DWR9_9HYPH|nr:hypothetical protein [Agrobacterium larrymoorei]QCI98632.1 hypothetical protein CFBP5473_12435 [Agrobacterium larrymoorei]QYA05904.1 hypothetical protein J5285_07300 [Agrobacterium larrymoorei]